MWKANPKYATLQNNFISFDRWLSRQIWIVKYISLGVSIMSLNLNIVKQFVLTIEKILTFSKSLSWHQCLDPKVSMEIEKFVKTWKFCHFLTVGLDLNCEIDGFLHISCEDFSICWDFSSFSYSKCLHSVKISGQILICLDNLNNLDKNLDKTKSRLISLDFKTLNQDKKKVCLDSQEIIDRF